VRQAHQRINWEILFNLFYLGFLFFQPLFDPGWDWRNWLATAALIGLFLPLYFWAFTRQGRRLLWATAGMIVLGVLGLVFPFNTGATVFLIYAAATAGFIGTPRFAGGVVVFIFLATLATLVLSPTLFPYRWAVFAPALIFVPLVGAMNVLLAERQRSNARLRLAQEEVERLAAIAERERIARDLHDLLGHTLSLITLKSELAARLIAENPERAKTEIGEVEAISRKTLAQVRAAVAGYRSQGLAGEIANAKLALEAAGIAFSCRVEPQSLPPKQESALAMVLREAVTNVIRHSQATRCTVEIGRDDQQLLLSVADDGTGGKVVEGAGLSGIRERVRALGGYVQRITTAGSRLLVSIPYTDPYTADEGKTASGSVAPLDYPELEPR